jgi:hypothetical protein
MIKKFFYKTIAIYYYLKSFFITLKFKRSLEDDLIYTTQDNFEILVYPGKKEQSEFDFIVKFRRKGTRRERTPKHIHFIVELYVKYYFDKDLTLGLKEHILEMLRNIKPANTFPPSLQFFKPEHVDKFRKLDKFGELSVEFLLVAIELVAIQEKTNYPKGTLTEKLYKDLFVKDRFYVIQKATWRNR